MYASPLSYFNNDTLGDRKEPNKIPVRSFRRQYDQKLNNQMERQENPFMVKPTPPLGTFGILREALKITYRNGRLSAVTLLLVLFSMSQLEFGTKMALTPLLKDLSRSPHWRFNKKAISFQSQPSSEFKYAHTPQIAQQRSYIFSNEITETGSVQHIHYLPQTNQDVFPAIGYVHNFPYGGAKDVSSLLEMQFIVLSIFCVILLFLLVAAISSSYEAYTAKVMSLKDVLLTFRGSWIRPVHTCFCLSLIPLGHLGLFTILIRLVSIYAEGYPSSSILAISFSPIRSSDWTIEPSHAYLLNALVSILSSVWYFHLTALWVLSLVVSVLESDARGFRAINRAADLMKGKIIQANVLVSLFDFATGAVLMISSAYIRRLDKWAGPFTMELICIIKLFMMAAFVIYYHESKMSRNS